MTIRYTESKDLDRVMDIYRYAQRQMALNGNPTQWGTEWPPRDVIINDIKEKISYVVCDGDYIYGVFALIPGKDPTYDIIIGGEWLNEDPYVVIHRIAGDGTHKGVLESAIELGNSMTGNVRIDTHEKNTIMRHLLEKFGFTECGIIYTNDGTERIAYQKYAK